MIWIPCQPARDALQRPRRKAKTSGSCKSLAHMTSSSCFYSPKTVHTTHLLESYASLPGPSLLERKCVRSPLTSHKTELHCRPNHGARLETFKSPALGIFTRLRCRARLQSAVVFRHRVLIKRTNQYLPTHFNLAATKIITVFPVAIPGKEHPAGIHFVSFKVILTLQVLL